MTQFLDMLRPDFLLHHALYGGLVVGAVCPLVGVYFVLRRLVFWGVALPQVSAAGASCALMLQGLGLVLAGGEAGEKHLAILGAVVFTGAALLLLAWLEHRSGPSEGRVGALYALAAAATILFVASNAQGESEMMSLLRGEIVTLSESDFHLMLDLLIGVCAVMFLFRREFLLVSFDRDMAVALGRRAGAWDALLLLLVGLTVSLGTMTVGPLVIFGLLVLPPITALPWARGMTALSLSSSAVGAGCAFTGFYLSYRFDLPLGPSIVAVLGAALAASTLARRLAPRASR